MKMRRRRLIELAVLGGVGQLASGTPRVRAAQASFPWPRRFGRTRSEARGVAAAAHAALAEHPGLRMQGQEQVGMLVYPGMTMLDLVGPQYFLASMMGAQVHLVSKDDRKVPVMGDTGFAVVPTSSFSTCPEQLDVLFVPGGTRGTLDAMGDSATLDFLTHRARTARYIVSVCTGALLLGQAGLLEGKRATTHWSVHHLLPRFGAKAVRARHVHDGRVFTGAGVSAGLDLALALLVELRGVPYAKVIQLQAEYAPEPSLDAGTPEALGAELGRPLHEAFAPAIVEFERIASERRSRGLAAPSRPPTSQDAP